jgi:hypothetical protein
LAIEFEDQIRKSVFIYFHVLCGKEFLGPQKDFKKSPNRVEKFVLQMGRDGIKRYNKLEPKNSIFRDSPIFETHVDQFKEEEKIGPFL